MPYAERTEVPVSRSKAEIEGLIEKYGGTKYQSGWDSERALVAFECEARRVRFVRPKAGARQLMLTVQAAPEPGGQVNNEAIDALNRMAR